MKRTAIIWFLSVMGWLGSPTPAAEGTKLAFDTYSGYFVSNKFQPDAAQSFLVIHDQKQFDAVFGVAMVMGDKSHRLPKNAFKSKLVLASIKRGSAVWEFKTESVTLNQGMVTLRYTTTSTKSESATFACPLIVSIPKGDYTAVQFVENKKPVKKVFNAVSASSAGPFQPTWDSLKSHRDPEWFRDAKFGIYTHWGPVTVGCEDCPFGREYGQWYGRE